MEIKKRKKDILIYYQVGVYVYVILGKLHKFTFILILEIFCQSKLITWTSFIGQFVHPVGGGDMGKGGIVILASYKFHFIRVSDNLV